MKVSKVFSGDYLKAADLDGNEPTVVISEVKEKEFDDGLKLIISFQGKKKSLVANKTNSNRIKMLYGDETDDWIGREVILYTDIVDFQGEPKPAIRVRPPAKRGTPSQSLGEPHGRYEDPRPARFVGDDDEEMKGEF